uniref:Uncharacterized protein n=1 Tax=Arundo donax TaxID=35708 RepID=A0A0A8YSR7_ARUDO
MLKWRGLIVNMLYTQLHQNFKFLEDLYIKIHLLY